MIAYISFNRLLQGQDIDYKVCRMDSEIIHTKRQQVLCLYFHDVYTSDTCSKVKI